MENELEPERQQEDQPANAESTEGASGESEDTLPIQGEILADGEPIGSLESTEDSGTGSGHALPFPIVGIGGSAGSIEPFMEVFQKLPARTGMAFVVVLHLLPSQESRLPEIIARQTSMPVHQIKDGLLPQVDHVYVIPPNFSVLLQGGRLRLQPRSPSGLFLPINTLFQSLAAEQRNFAIGVVLSGMDGDGALGMRAIKGEGGFSLVQNPSSARQPGMPTNSIANGHVDMILEPGEIAVQLAALGRRFSDASWLRLEEGTPTFDDEREFTRVLKLLKTVSGIDFRLYKPATIRRRVARRIVVHKLDSLADYTAMLQGSSTELRALQEDILINVTRFFRDAEVFDMLKRNVIPRIFAEKENEQQIRVWVAGCSTGEEVYSLAMCLLEHLSGDPLEPGIQIFGTDASEENVQRARLGNYPESIIHEVTPERLRRFFIKTEKGYQVNKRVRDLCIFARQNLSVDPPFSRLDIVSCRNVMIYFGPELQARVISTFHYALNPDSYLLLGSSESIREFTDLFTVVDRTYKLFTRVESLTHRALVPAFAPLSFPEASHEVNLPANVYLRRDADLNGLADRTILARYGPPGVIINREMEILQTRGRTSPFLEMAAGTASLQLARMLRESIAPEVMAAVIRGIRDCLPVQVDPLIVLTGDSDKVFQARLEVLPMPTGESTAAVKYFLVSFLPSLHFGTDPAAAVTDQRNYFPGLADLTLGQLQQDLSSTKLYLNSLLDEREATNQELISANEEIQSSNEELQSTNEELETTKEELQSSNEELQTVNDELQDRNSVLTQASNDLTNLLNSVNMPVLMLTGDLYIRHFTPQSQKLMNLRPQDIGRPFGEIRLNLAIENLEDRLTEVLDTLAPQEHEVQDRDGRWYFLRIRPYRTTENKIDGLLLVLVDIDQSRRSQHELRDARDFAASVISNTPLPLVVVDADFRIVYINDAFCDLCNLPRQAVERRGITDLAGVLWNMELPLRSLLHQVKENRAADGSFECDYKHRDGTTHSMLIQGKPLQPDGERFALITFQDITPHREIERLLKGEGERLATLVAETTRELDRNREELRALTDMLMTTQEDERRRVARELHDDVSQRLALLDMECETALGLFEADPPAAHAKIVHLREQVAEISAGVRTLSHRLHPSILEHLGTAAALEALLDEFTEREGILTGFYTNRGQDELPLEVATGLYRIAQEALRNISKHAGKAHVKISLLTSEQDGAKRLTLDITDSGRGFDPDQHSPGLGLISMKERSRLLGGTLHLQSTPHRGTTVTVELPLPSDDPQPTNLPAQG